MRVNLSATFVHSVKPPERGQVDYWDGRLTGFGLRVSEGGTRSWFAFYRGQDGRNRRMKIGNYPLLPLADARQKAKRILRQASDGDDPAHDKRVSRTADTFGDLADAYLEEHAKKKKRTWAEDERIIERELKRPWANRRAGEITRRDLKELLNRIIDRGSAVMANRT